LGGVPPSPLRRLRSDRIRLRRTVMRLPWTLARLGRASATGSSARKRTEAHGSAAHGVRLVALGHREAHGSATLRPRFVTLGRASTRYRRSRNARMLSGRARMRQDRRGRGEATLGRPDAGTRYGASYACAGEACTILHHSGHEKARATLRCPGFACLGSTYRRRMRIKSAARQAALDPRSGRIQAMPGRKPATHAAM
jgi:hypothetical protein